MLELGREQLDISDYSLSQTTLDDVFIHFASMQSEDVGLCGREEEEEEERGRRVFLSLPDVVPDTKDVSDVITMSSYMYIPYFLE